MKMKSTFRIFSGLRQELEGLKLGICIADDQGYVQIAFTIIPYT